MNDTYFDYKKMMNEIDAYMAKYPFISVNGICESMLSHIIPTIIMGEGKSIIAYVGGEEGCDTLSPFLLLRFIRDICSLYKEGGSAFGFSAESILKNYTIIIIPMLNPDGSCYCSEGLCENNPLKERALKLNEGKETFTHWRGNARGIELKYNYSTEYSEVEPEIEVGALCNFLRYGLKPDILISISQSHFEDSENIDGKIYYGEGEIENKMAIALSQMGGLKRFYRESKAPRLMLADWAIQEIGASAFSIELPSLSCSNQKQFNSKSFSYYTKIRKIFFCAPLLNKIK